ncbi:MAG: SCO family protein [Sneathiellaceae bacterium]
MIRALQTLVLAALVVAAIAAPAALAGLSRAQLDAVGVTPQPGAPLPMAQRLRDAQGRTGTLADAAGGQPFALFFVDYGCRMVCGAALRTLSGLMAELPAADLAGWRLLVVGLDPSDGPAESGVGRAGFLAVAPDAAAMSVFLTGTEDAIAALAAASGYRYAFDAERDEYAHPVSLVIADADGRVQRYLSPLAAAPQDLRFGLQDAGVAPQGLLQAVRALCYRFDPQTGRYTPLIDRILAALALLSLAVLAVGVLLLLRQGRRRGGAAAP